MSNNWRILHQLQHPFQTVRLHRVLKGEFISRQMSACLTTMDHHVPFFTVGFNPDRLQNPMAVGSPISRENIEVNGKKTVWAMIAAAARCGRLHLRSAVYTAKRFIANGKLAGCHVPAPFQQIIQPLIQL